MVNIARRRSALTFTNCNLSLRKESEFHDHLSFSGLKYLFRSESWQFRFWLAVLLLMSSASLLAALHIFNSFIKHPTLIALRMNEKPYLFDFPTVSVCTENIFPIKRVETLIENLILPGSVSKQKVKSYIQGLTEFFGHGVYKNGTNLEIFEKILYRNGIDTSTMRKILSSPCPEIITSCVRRDLDNEDCTDAFMPEITTRGLCCGLNFMKEFDLCPECSNKQSRLRSTSIMTAVLLKINHEDIFARGFRSVAMTRQDSYPNIDKYILTLNRGNDHIVSLKYQIVVAGESLSEVARNARDCVYPTEVKLKYFHIYTKFHCTVNCEMEATFAKCGCFLPRHPAEPGCPPSKAACAYRVIEAAKCYCPEECEYTKLATAYTSVAIENKHTIDPFFVDFNSSTSSSVRFYVEFPALTKRVRLNYYPWVKTFAQIGGVITVYIGGSIISLLELILFVKCWWRANKASDTIANN